MTVRIHTAAMARRCRERDSCSDMSEEAWIYRGKIFWGFTGFRQGNANTAFLQIS